MFPNIRYSSTQAKLMRHESFIQRSYVSLYSLHAKAHSRAFGERGKKMVKAFGFRLQPSLWIKEFWMGEEVAVMMKGGNAHPNNGLFVRIDDDEVWSRTLDLHREVSEFHRYADPNPRLAWEEEIRNHKTTAKIP